MKKKDARAGNLAQFVGPYRCKGKNKVSLFESARGEQLGGPIIDIHVRFGAPLDPQSGCFWSEEFAKTPAYYAMLLITRSLFKKVNIDYIKQRTLWTLNESQFEDRAVFLAPDKVYDAGGNPVRKKRTPTFPEHIA